VLLGGRTWLCLAAAVLLLAGCGGGKDLIDDSLSTPDQIRSLVQQFEAATARNDDAAACDLMNESMRRNIVLHGVPEDSPRGHCSIDAALFYPGERPSLPTARVVEIRPDRHDQLADVYMDNGSRFRLQREGESADGEWRIYAINLHSFAVPESKVAEVRARTPDCRAEQLSLSRRLVVPQTGEHGAQFVLTNQRKQSCLLSGRPRLQFLSRGVPIPFHYRDSGGLYLPQLVPETILVPSSGTAAFLAVKYRCDVGIADVSDEVRVALPGAGPEPLSQSMPRSTSEFQYCQPFHGAPANDPGNSIAVSPILASLRDVFGR
jgi:hypothetical protein